MLLNHKISRYSKPNQKLYCRKNNKAFHKDFFSNYDSKTNENHSKLSDLILKSLFK